MAVTRAEVEAVAALARLRLEPEEAERLTSDLNDILDHVAILETLDSTDDAQPPETGVRLRDDVPGADALAAPIAEIAPEWRDGFFLLPRLPALEG